MATNTTIDPDNQTVQLTPESGLRFDRVHFCREELEGETPDDPEMLLFSDLLVNFEASLDPGTEGVQGLGSAHPAHFSRALPESEVTVGYALQRALVDTDDTLQDPAADALLRDLANQIPNTHTVVARDNNPSPGMDDPEGCKGQRQYLVLKGAKANLSMEPDATTAQPTVAELTYTPGKARSYHIYQPEGEEALSVVSTSDADTSQTVTIESEGGALSEELDLNGTTPVEGTESFGDIDAIELSDTTEGDVEVMLTSTDSTIAVIRGGEYYAEDEGTAGGDLGIPTIGEGSFQEEVGAGYESFHGDTVERPESVPVAPELNNITLEVENNLEAQPRQDGQGVRVAEGNQNITITTNVVGEKTSHDMIEEAFALTGLDLEWELSRTRMTFPEATVTSPPARTRESDQTFAEQDVGFQSKGVQLANLEE